MPYSDAENKDRVVEWYERIQPHSVVDVGAGSGTYAKLLRPLDAGLVEGGPAWFAVEIWAPYVEQFGLRMLYDVVYVADVRLLDQQILESDLIIFGDVLEHMEKGHAKCLLHYVSEFCDNIIVSVPVLHLDQGTVEGNPHETHVDHWTHEEMTEFLSDGGVIGGEVVDSVKGEVLSYHWWRAE